MRYLLILACFSTPLNWNSFETGAPECRIGTCCEHACESERPAGDAKNWACSNHDPQHLVSAREIAACSKENGCKGWKRIR